MVGIEYTIQRREDLTQGPLSVYDPEAFGLLQGAFGFMRGVLAQDADRRTRMTPTEVRTPSGLVLAYTVNADGRDRVFTHEPGTAGLGYEWSTLDGGELVTGYKLTTTADVRKDIDNHPVMLLFSTDLEGAELPPQLQVGISIEETALDGLYVYTAGQLPDQRRFDPYDHLRAHPSVAAPIPPQ